MMTSTSLPKLADELLAAAHDVHAGRASRTIRGHSEHRLRHTVIALTSGSTLSDHEGPGEATLHVLRGRVRLTSADGDWTGEVGDLVDIPGIRHGLTAESDAVVLLTVGLAAD
ncbi:cupin [Gordonia zhaorongruii]|uniref:cupin n=1 Tax=Gordonia zhaorongruii TaxID=2597659 RepID=UPI003CC82CC0